MQQSNFHTIVVGSGMAGTAAASQLAKNGFSVLILEANSYIGGRTKTIPVKLPNQKTFCFDEGASWIHGSSKQNPITRLSKQIGKVKAVMTDDDSIINFDQYGKPVDKQVQVQFEEYDNLLQRIQDLEGLSVFQAIKKLNGKKLANKYFMYNVSNDIQFQTSAPIQDLSAQHGQSDSQIQGKQMLVLTGYQAFPEYLSRHENIRVLKNHPVVQIQSNGSKTIVKCSNGKIFQAPNIVISVPIGALKNKNIRFSPELPPWKQEAINKIHFGNVCKIIIILKNKIPNMKQHYVGVVAEDVQKRGCATYFLNISGLTGLPVIMTFGLGANADELEFMPENQLKALITSRLRVFLDGSVTPNDFDIRRTSWRGNPNFRGTYSYSGVETLPKHWQNMAKPIFERNMYFCGEHTHSKYRGTAHGAFLSGVDSASSILKNANNKTWRYKGKQEDSDQQNQQNNEEESAKVKGQRFAKRFIDEKIPRNPNQVQREEYQGQNQQYGQQYGQEYGQPQGQEYGQPYGQQYGQEQGQGYDDDYFGSEYDGQYDDEYGQEYDQNGQFGQEYDQNGQLGQDYDDQYYGQEPEQQIPGGPGGYAVDQNGNKQQIKGRRIIQKIKRSKRES